jgi:hypothetical protein
MTDAARAALRTVLDPKSVAIVGASENPNKLGGARGLVTGVAGRSRVARLVRRATESGANFWPGGIWQ